MNIQFLTSNTKVYWSERGTQRKSRENRKKFDDVRNNLILTWGKIRSKIEKWNFNQLCESNSVLRFFKSERKVRAKKKEEKLHWICSKERINAKFKNKIVSNCVVTLNPSQSSCTTSRKPQHFPSSHQNLNQVIVCVSIWSISHSSHIDSIRADFVRLFRFDLTPFSALPISSNAREENFVFVLETNFYNSMAVHIIEARIH